jgi:hypothetical protein
MQKLNEPVRELTPYELDSVAGGFAFAAGGNNTAVVLFGGNGGAAAMLAPNVQFFVNAAAWGAAAT